ncbi:MAG: class I SAM-dependent methyltransferase [Syntrophobacteraceae bacterium]|jgi:cyclopropane fatty-acyl-phospholipid synthase-like methyltransferase
MNTYANADVLEFYKQLPFNYSSDISQAAIEVMSGKQEILKFYVPIAEEILLQDDLRVLELGCGTGWLSTLLANYYGCSVTAIDFNPVAIEQAKRMSEAIAGNSATKPKFEVTDLFLFDATPFDIVISHGVLHHTNDCIEGIRKACGLTKKRGHIILGLYNRFGRKPFLDYFDSLRAKGYTEEELFVFYKRLDPRHNNDDTLARSWFNDQVLHPHETQHTVTEVIKVFAECGVKWTATSIDGYCSKPKPDLESILLKEKQMHDAGLRAIDECRYYTGYFVITGEKI